MERADWHPFECRPIRTDDICVERFARCNQPSVVLTESRRSALVLASAGATVTKEQSDQFAKQ